MSRFGWLVGLKLKLRDAVLRNWCPTWTNLSALGINWVVAVSEISGGKVSFAVTTPRIRRGTNGDLSWTERGGPPVILVVLGYSDRRIRTRRLATFLLEWLHQGFHSNHISLRFCIIQLSPFFSWCTLENRFLVRTREKSGSWNGILRNK